VLTRPCACFRRT